MIEKIEYQEYLGVDTAPFNFKRLEYISLNELKSIMQLPVPAEDNYYYEDFKKALMEQMNYFFMNPEIVESYGSTGYSLGSYSENASNQNNDKTKSIDKISPVAYDILLNSGLLYSGL